MYNEYYIYKSFAPHSANHNAKNAKDYATCIYGYIPMELFFGDPEEQGDYHLISIL